MEVLALKAGKPRPTSGRPVEASLHARGYLLDTYDSEELFHEEGTMLFKADSLADAAEKASVMIEVAIEELEGRVKALRGRYL